MSGGTIKKERDCTMKNTLSTYISVSATNYSARPDINTGYMYVYVSGCELEVHTPLSYKEAKKQLAKLAVKHNLQIERKPNPLDTSIVTYGINGFLD